MTTTTDTTDNQAAPARVWLVTHTDRHGVGNWAFSSEEKAGAFAEQLARARLRRWRVADCDNLTGADLWAAFSEECSDDETIEQDSVDIDAPIDPDTLR